MIHRRQLLQSLAISGAAASLGMQPGFAQSNYPSKSIKIIVPLPPGSPADVLARITADALSRQWSQAIVVENRPGATGMIGLQAVTRAAPDGYTLGIVFLTHTVLPQLMGPLPYDTEKDLAPVANLVWLYNVLAVPVNSPIQNLEQLITQAKAKDNKLSFGSGGNGSPAHLIAESFSQAVKAHMLHVPFKGPAEAVTGLMSDQVSCMFATSPTAAPLVRAGKLRALAVTSPQRLSALSDVPTLAESGMPNLELREWEGIVAPAGTPKAIIDKWNKDLFQVLNTPEVRNRLADLGMSVAAPNQPEEFGKLISKELIHWKQFARTAGLKAG